VEEAGTFIGMAAPLGRGHFRAVHVFPEGDGVRVVLEAPVELAEDLL